MKKLLIFTAFIGLCIPLAGQNRKEEKKPEEILELHAEGGMYTGQKPEGGYKSTGGAGILYRRQVFSAPSIIFQAEGSHNQEDGSPADIPGNKGHLYLNIGNALDSKIRWNNIFDINYMDCHMETADRYVYQPTGFYKSRFLSKEGSLDKRGYDASYMGNISIDLSPDDLFEASWSVMFGQEWEKATDMAAIKMDALERISILEENEAMSAYGASAHLNYTHRFQKEGRDLTMEAAYRHEGDFGKGESLDKNEAGHPHRWLQSDKRTGMNLFSFEAAYSEPLSRKFTLSAVYGLDGEISNNKKDADDMIAGTGDRFCSYDFKHEDISNSAGLDLTYKNFSGSLDFDAGLEYSCATQKRTETFPIPETESKTFHHIAPSFKLDWHIPSFKIKVTYDEFQELPSAMATRNILYNREPYFLYAGNPELTQSIRRDAALSFGIRSEELHSTWNSNIRFSNLTNAVCNNTEYFGSDTVLEEYGFTAPAGAILTTPVNLSGCRSVSADFMWEGNSEKLRTEMHFGPGYRYGQLPHMTGDTRHMTGQHSLNFDLGFNTAITDSIDIEFSSNTILGRNLLDKSRLYDSIQENLYALFSIDFLKRWNFNTDLDYSVIKASVEDIDPYENINWSMELSCRFGKKDNCRIGLKAYDLLDHCSIYDYIIRDNYIRSAYTDSYGRAVVLSFRYLFR